MGKRIEDLTGRRFGKVVVKGFHGVNKNRVSQWLCECDCGNEIVVIRNSLISGNTTSCGCKYRSFGDITGKRFGKLTAIEFDHKDANNKSYWLCECDCGNKTIVSRSSLTSERTKSCGCSRRENLSGKKFGRLTVLDLDHTDWNNISFWRCLCDCGNEVVVRSTSLKNGMSKSCGCYKREVTIKRMKKHGLCDHPLYVVWTDMKRRCHNETDPAWVNYGGRGIYVCDEWISDFENFYEWAINNGWEAGLTLDREDNDDGYTPWNCRFVDRRIQSNNRRSNRLIRYGDEIHSVAQWSDILDVDYFRLINRINRGNLCDFEEYFGFADPYGGDIETMKEG